MVTTPTNHTSSAFFGGLEAQLSESMSLDEQSSIDSSQLMESSTHTSSLLGGLSAADTSINPSRRGTRTSVLEAVIEESTSHPDDSHRANPSVPFDEAADPIFDGLQDTDLPAPNPMNRNCSTTTAKTSTMHTSKSGVVTMPSRTMHTSNVNATSYKQMEEESDRYAAWAIHVVLGVFCGLVVISVLLSFVVIRKFGLVAMFGLSLLLCFTIFLMWFVDSLILSQDVRFKPMRNKIVRVVEVAKQVVVDEFNLFKRDWNEHFLLTNGPCNMEMGGGTEGDPTTTAVLPATKKRRSVVFKLIKPIFGSPKKLFKGRKGRSRRAQSRAREMAYHPPDAKNGVIA